MPEIKDLDGLDQRIVTYVRTLGPRSDGRVRITGHGLARDLSCDVDAVREALARLESSYLAAERRQESSSEHWDVFGLKDGVTG